MRTLSEIYELVPAAGDDGLPPDAVEASRQRFGANVLTRLPRQPVWKKFLAKFDDPIIQILLAAALLSMVVQLLEASLATGASALALVGLAVGVTLAARKAAWLPVLLFVLALGLAGTGFLLGHPLVEGLAVMVAVVLATGVAFLNEYRSDREFDVLVAQKEAIRAKVRRQGEIHSLPLDEVVVGDAVVLEMGDEVPADGRLIRATDLEVDQALLTGESRPARKKAQGPDGKGSIDHPGCLYRGTQVVDGVGEMIVAEVGDTTSMGLIARSLAAQPVDREDRPAPADTSARVRDKLTLARRMTPLQGKLQVLAHLISRVGYAAALAIFFALLLRGLFFADPPEVFWPHDRAQALQVADNLLRYLVYMVIIIVVAVPEGLPMSVTVSLALAMRKMTRANSLVRQLVACETVGSATVICSDKTGTLTQNRMTVVRLHWDGLTFDRGRADWPRLPPAESWQDDARPLAWVALNAAVNSTAHLEQRQGRDLTLGNITEGALLRWLRDSGVDYLPLRRRFPPLYAVHFSSDRKRMTSVVRRGDELVALVKGAPEWVLDHSTYFLGEDGRERPWTEAARDAVSRALHDSSRQAMRTLAFAYSWLPPETPPDPDVLRDLKDDLESRLVFVGLAGLQDPVRDDVPQAVRQCRQAGIQVVMITGDNPETARAVARDIGLLPAETRDPATAGVMVSPEFEARSDDELRRLLPAIRVLARARPVDKVRMVQLLQEQGHVVAVTGDGTNDAPALRNADVGLAMGLAGTEVAKEASKIVLLDDSFSTIVRAVHWGRSLYENIQRFLQFQLTINVSALVIAFLGPFFGIRPPFTVLQLLWINVIMDTFAAIALCSEPPREGLMDRPPRRKDEPILTRPMLATIFTTAAFFVVVMTTLLAGMEWSGWFRGPGPSSPVFPVLTTRQVSIFFSVYVFFQVWNQVNCRSLVPEVSGLRHLGRNPIFLLIAGLVAVVQVAIVSIPALGSFFAVEPLGLRDWALILLGTSSVLLFSEIARWVRLGLARPPATEEVFHA